MVRAPLPALPPSPMLLGKQVPPKFRPIVFWPVALVSGFLLLFLTGLFVGDFEPALVVGLIAGPVIGYLAVGPPFTRAQVAQAWARIPRASPEKRPLLFFPAAIVGAALLYFLLGIIITSTPADTDLLAVVALGVAIPAAIALGGLAYGFPHPRQHFAGPLHARWARVPVEKRPLLFFPLALLLAAPIYILVGYALTEGLAFEYDALLALAVALVAGFWVAFKAVGAPSVAGLRERAARLPEVPARARPAAFFAVVVVLGAVFAVILGGTIGGLDLFGNGAALDLAFPLFLLAGWLLAAPVGAHFFGYPVPEQPLRAYLPRFTPEQRPAVLLPLTFGLGVVLMFVLGIGVGQMPYDLDSAPLIALVSFPIAFLVSMRLLHVRPAQMDPRALAHAPEAARPVVLLALWVLAGTLAFVLIVEVLPSFEVAAGLGYSIGLAAALLLVDRPLLTEPVQRARAARAKEREVEARLRREMGLEEPAPAASEGGRFRLRGRGKA